MCFCTHRVSKYVWNGMEMASRLIERMEKCEGRWRWVAIDVHCAG